MHQAPRNLRVEESTSLSNAMEHPFAFGKPVFQ
jgi:hypothetical protein